MTHRRSGQDRGKKKELSLPWTLSPRKVVMPLMEGGSAGEGRGEVAFAQVGREVPTCIQMGTSAWQLGIRPGAQWSHLSLTASRI